MNIFGGRPGIAAGVLAVIAILAACFWDLTLNITILILALIFVIVCAVLCACKYISPYRMIANCVVAAMFVAAMLRGLDTFYVDVPNAEMHCGENKYVHATVEDRRFSGDYYTVYIVRIHSIDGVEHDGKAILYCEYNSDLQDGYEFILRNATVSFVFNLIPSEAMSFVSEETFLYITSEEAADYAILSENEQTVFDRLESLNSYLSAKLQNDIKGEEGRLTAAMLLGDLSGLTPLMYRDFTRSGLLHYLSVSGLHVSIITAVVSFVLLHLRIKRWLRNLLITAFAVGYLFLLGFPVSAVRSVLMLLTVFLAYSMGDSSDSLNALGIAALVIILLEPLAVFDESFILSFCATLGIVCFMPIFNDLINKIFKSTRKKGGRSKEFSALLLSLLKKTVSFVFGALMCTSASLSLTLLPLTYLYGETSVIGYESNLIAAFVGTIHLSSSAIYLFLGDVPYIGEALEIIIRSAARCILDVAAECSEVEGAVVPLITDGVCSIVWIFSIAVYLVLLLKIKHKKPLLIVPALYPAAILAIILTASSALPATSELIFISTGKDENILSASAEGAVLIDVSDGSYMRLSTLSAEAHASGYTEFDALILTHYHTKHLASVTHFVSGEMVRKLVLPYPETEDDAWIMKQLVDTVSPLGVVCEVVEPFAEIQMPGGATLSMSDISRLERSTHPMLYLSFSDEDERITYVGESSWEHECEGLGELIEESNILFFGGHGPIAKVPFDISAWDKYSVVTDEELLRFLKPTEGVVGVEKWKYVFSENEN